MILFNQSLYLELQSGYNPNRYILSIKGENLQRLYDDLVRTKLTEVKQKANAIEYHFNVRTPYATIHLGLCLSTVRSFDTRIQNHHFEDIARNIKACLGQGTGRLDEVLTLLSQTDHAAELAKILPKRVATAPHWVIEKKQTMIYFFNTKDQPNITKITVSVPQDSSTYKVCLSTSASAFNGLVARLPATQQIETNDRAKHIYFAASGKGTLLRKLESIAHIHLDIELITLEIRRLLNTPEYNVHAEYSSRVLGFSRDIPITFFGPVFDNYARTGQILENLYTDAARILDQPPIVSAPPVTSTPIVIDIGANARALEGKDITIPEALRCPILRDIMTTPAYVEDLETNQCFEYSIIKGIKDRNEPHPTTRQSLQDKEIIVNTTLEKACADFVAEALAPAPAPAPAPEQAPTTLIEVKMKRKCCTIL